MKKLSSDVLREHKGISFTGIGTIFFCYDKDGMLFLAKRSKNSRDEHGKWDPGGGGLKHGFTLEENLRRELKEEYDVEPIKIDYLGYREVFRTINGELSHWLSMDFAIKVDHDKVRINEPDMFDDSGWFTLDNLPTPMHSQWDAFMKINGAKLKNVMQKGSSKLNK